MRSIRLSTLRLLLPGFAALLVGTVACGPGGGETGGALPDGAFFVDANAFVRDTPAIGADWYDYDDVNHTVAPTPVSYVVQDDATGEAAAFRIRSYYDGETGTSGRFTLERAVYDEGRGWADLSAWTLDANVKTDGPACVDLFRRIEVACDGDAWHVQFRVFPMLIPEAQLVVGNPGVFVRGIAGSAGAATTVATVDAALLEEVPAPTSLDPLDVERRPWNAPDWDRRRLAVNLPPAGMAVGDKLTDQSSPEGDVFFLLAPDFSLVRFAATIDADDAGGAAMTVRSGRAAMDLDSGAHLPFGETQSTTLVLPSPGHLTYATFTESGIDTLADDATLVDQLKPPEERSWDFAIENVDGVFRFLLSPSSAVFNLTADGGEDATALDDAMPPLNE